MKVTAAAKPLTTPSSPPSPHSLPDGQMFQQEVYSIQVKEGVAVPRLQLDLGQEVVCGGDQPVH